MCVTRLQKSLGGAVFCGLNFVTATQSKGAVPCQLTPCIRVYSTGFHSLISNRSHLRSELKHFALFP